MMKSKKWFEEKLEKLEKAVFFAAREFYKQDYNAAYDLETQGAAPIRDELIAEFEKPFWTPIQLDPCDIAKMKEIFGEDGKEWFIKTVYGTFIGSLWLEDEYNNGFGYQYATFVQDGNDVIDDVEKIIAYAEIPPLDEKMYNESTKGA